MNISLTPEMEQYIQKQVKSGRYHTSSELVRDALRIHQVHEEVLNARMAQFRAEVQKGIDDVKAGRVTEFNFERIRKGGQKLLAARRKAQAK